MSKINKKIQSTHYLILMVWILWTLFVPMSFARNKLNTVSISQATLDALPSCLHYKVVGTCFWMVCHVGCAIVLTPKVDHYLPDVVVTTYPKYQKDPWFEMNESVDPAAYEFGNALFKQFIYDTDMKSGSFDTANSSDQDTRFREVNVIGNPALAILNQMSMLLKGQTSAYVPYYQSLSDGVEWRSGLWEQLNPNSWIPGKDDVGTFLINEWGATYPRQGFIMQPNIAKASAVLAVRGANIASTISPHIRKPFSACPEKDCETAGSILSNHKKTTWQMLLPKTSTVCRKRIDDKDSDSWTNNTSEKQSYAWVVWREYRGCLPGPGHYIGSTGD